MSKTVSKPTLAASLSLALAFTFSCSDDSGNSNVGTCGNREYNTTEYSCERGELVGSCKGKNYYPDYQYCENGEVKDLSFGGSSSSGGDNGDRSSSSVGGESSSSNKEWSSSSVERSSSSSAPSSSSVAPSSSSVKPSSSSSVPSSSSVAPSSSSVKPSSSSSVPSSSSVGGGSPNTFVDSRDGKIYKKVTIGTQTWMAENLNYEVSGSKCYNNYSSNCNTYGRLYNWSTAMNLPSTCNSNSCSSQIQSKHRGICPEGWHLPSDAEWTVLENAFGDINTAGTKLKATTGWSNNGNGTDNYGFSALPGGGGQPENYPGDSFFGVGESGRWWSTYEHYDTSARHRYMYYNIGNMKQYDYGKRSLSSVRCLQD